MSKDLRVLDLVKKFQLEVLVGDEGLEKEISVDDLHRPGLEMAGYFEYYPSDRIQILGRTEISFVSSLPANIRSERMKKFCCEDTPCIVIARGFEPPDELIEEGKRVQIPILRSQVPTTILFSRITNFLESQLAPSTTIHGVLVDVYGAGVLLMGKSGIGKSETALELVKRGHRLVADDAVEIRQTSDSQLYGTSPTLIRHLLEIRGVGIINVMTLFGVGAIRHQKKISLVIQLEAWQQQKQYDRLGLDEETIEIIDAKVPMVTIPVQPGRNLAIIVEVAAMNFALKRIGYNAAVQFTDRLTEAMGDEGFDEIDD